MCGHSSTSLDANANNVWTVVRMPIQIIFGESSTHLNANPVNMWIVIHKSGCHANNVCTVLTILDANPNTFWAVIHIFRCNPIWIGIQINEYCTHMIWITCGDMDDYPRINWIVIWTVHIFFGLASRNVDDCPHTNWIGIQTWMTVHTLIGLASRLG